MKQFFATSWVLFLQAMTTQIYYRFAVLQRMIAEAIGHLPILMFWLAAGSAAQDRQGYSQMMLLFYFLAAASHEIIHDESMTRTIAFDIRMGRLATHLIRPYPFLAAAWMRILGTTFVRVISIAPISFAVIFLVPALRDQFLSHSYQQWLVYGAALILGVFMDMCLRSLVGMLAFDMTQTWGPELVFISVYVMLSGTMFPVDIMPEWAQQIVHWTPMYYMLGFPVLLFIGRIPVDIAWQQFGQGFIVFAILVIVLQLAWRRGISKFEAVGI